ncbi:MauE/DoxX family redox-associated membrane protein [Actinoallomurus soli]|uniref:MauE/DoxX family redox-associated membrane protein n=1 Tax=Actinoallomurus soli TaxID=2952535 RepID=UPI002093860D|nr:MauE/DoxX family redox-associated membrane protein [Actinoallomurus soli]MCO5967305.1 DoxX family membrane protein [Actinoallomurus soli]
MATKADSAGRRTRATKRASGPAGGKTPPGRGKGGSGGGKTRATDTRTGPGRGKADVDEGRTGLAGRIRVPALPERYQHWITLVVRVLLAGILGTAGYAKFTEPAALQKTAVSAYRILPQGAVTPVALGLPVLEMVLAVMILLGFATRVMAICVGLLFVVFIAGIISVAARGLSIDCGCFGGGGTVAKGQTHYLREVFRDLGFLVLAAWLMLYPRGKFALDRVLGMYA